MIPAQELHEARRVLIDGPSIAGSGLLAERAVVMNLGSLSTAREAVVAALSVLRVVLERRRERQPVLVVVDEAHSLFPATPMDGVARALCDLGVLIAGEGRKYGIHLLVCTQRPDKLHPNVVSQCDNLILLLVNSTRDRHAIAEVFSPVPARMIERASSLRLGETLLAGRIAPTPVFAKTRTRISVEGGGDVSTSWATRTS